jgi:hypothetical protein
VHSIYVPYTIITLTLVCAYYCELQASVEIGVGPKDGESASQKSFPAPMQAWLRNSNGQGALVEPTDATDSADNEGCF